MPSPSEPLLAMLRAVAQRKGMNTAALASAAGIERARLKHVLAGSEPLTVDELVALSTALSLGAEDLAGIGLKVPDGMALEDPVDETPAPEDDAPALRSIDRRQRPPVAGDPFGNHAEQILQLGFALGVDIFIILHTNRIGDSGVPRATLAAHPTLLPIRLDAAYHRYYDPRYLPDMLQLTLSFDALYTCRFPWSSIAEIRLFPLPPEPEETSEEPEAPERKHGHLRLLD